MLLRRAELRIKCGEITGADTTCARAWELLSSKFATTQEDFGLDRLPPQLWPSAMRLLETHSEALRKLGYADGAIALLRIQLRETEVLGGAAGGAALAKVALYGHACRHVYVAGDKGAART